MQNPTAAIIIIGNEILSGRTLDANTQYIAQKLSTHGIKLQETRIIPDDEAVIIANILELKAKYNYIFTTGGIGPTHDDITSNAVAKAFAVPLTLNAEAYRLIKEFYDNRGRELNSAIEKMAFIPENSILITNPLTAAPGYIIGNVYVLPGVPYIMQAMFDQLLAGLPEGKKILSKTIDIMLPESLIAESFSALQNKYPHVEMGSYPFENHNQHGTSLVLRSTSPELLQQAYNELSELLKEPVLK